MLHFLTGSSERNTSLFSSTAARASENVTASKFDEITADEPLPEIRRGDFVRLLVQSPSKLYLYWNFARDPFTTLRRMWGESASSYTLALRLVNVENGSETLQLTSPRATAAWLDAHAGRRYRVDVGFYSYGRPFIKLLSSNIVHTPRAGVSARVDAEPEFRAAASDFTRTLSEAGYVNDAIEVWLEAADEATGARATRIIAAKLGGAESPSDGEDLRGLRRLIAALAAGIPLERLRLDLSPPLARWLEGAQTSAVEGAVNPARLLEVLRSAFDFDLEYESFDETVSDARRGLAWTASDVRFPANLFHVWLPSMTAGLASRLASFEK